MRAHLQSECHTDQVHHHLFIGQLHADEGQEWVELLKVRLHAALFLTAQVDVSIQVLGMLKSEIPVNTLKTLWTSMHSLMQTQEKHWLQIRMIKAGSWAMIRGLLYLFHEEVVLTWALVHFEFKHRDIRDDTAWGKKWHMKPQQSSVYCIKRNSDFLIDIKRPENILERIYLICDTSNSKTEYSIHVEQGLILSSRFWWD